MAKTIKRVGIIFFVLVVSLLVAVGSVFAVDLTSNDFNVNANDISTKNDLGNQTNNYISSGSIYTPPTTDSVYYLNCSCPDGEACTCGGMAEIWNDAVKESLNSGKLVKVVLEKDWIAKKVDDPSIGTSFGEGIGFGNGYLRINENVRILIDLNGNDIDRRLTKEIGQVNGEVITLSGELHLDDSKYDSSAIDRIYNEINEKNYGTFVDFRDEIDAKKADFQSKLSNLDMGKITGGAREMHSGGAIVVSKYGVFNMYGGIFANNHAHSGGGAIATVSECVGGINIYDGLFACNSADSAIGALDSYCDLNLYNAYFLFNSAPKIGAVLARRNMYMYGGLFAYNKHEDNGSAQVNNGQGGAICFISLYNGECKIYGGTIAYNYSGARAAGIYVYSGKSFDVYDVEMIGNKAYLFGGGIYTSIPANIYGGKFYYNQGLQAGAILCNNEVSIYDCEMVGNIAKELDSMPEDDENYGSHIAGGALFLNNKLSIYGGKIVENYSKDYGGAIAFGSKQNVNIGGPVQIYDNYTGEGASRRVSDIVLANGQKINVMGKLNTTTNIAKIGIDIEDDYSDETFTFGYSNFNAVKPSIFFFSNANNKSIKLSNVNNEVGLFDDTATKTSVTWSWEQDGVKKETQESNAVVTYTNKPFTLRCSAGNFYCGTSSTTAYNATVARKYSFYTTANCANPTFTFTILPKEVDLVWNTSYTYTGGFIVPTVEVDSNDIIEGTTCGVSTIVSQAKNVGSGYFAYATALNNSNYKISEQTKNTVFEILPADITIDINTISQQIEYNGKQQFSDSDLYELTHNGLGTDVHLDTETLFNVDRKSIVVEFTKEGVTTASAVNVGEYDITVKQFDASKVFTGNANYNVTVNYVNGGKLTITPSRVVRASVESGYDYLILDNDRRVAYKDRGMIHGENDSNVNVANGNAQYVIGNIMPETTVQTLLNGLVYNQATGSVVVYNKQGGIVADDNAVVGTGWYIEYANEKIFLSVLGDVTGDGRIDATDITYLRRVANGEVSDLSLAVQLAAMVDNRGKITSVDAEILRAVCKYEITIDMYF